jgi:hypothetical protein
MMRKDVVEVSGIKTRGKALDLEIDELIGIRKGEG